MMRVKELMELLAAYQGDDEVEIEIYETASDKYIDTTADITIAEHETAIPTLKIDVEAGKFKDIF